MPSEFQTGLHRYKGEKKAILCPARSLHRRMSESAAVRCLASTDGDEEFMWVKAGTPGEKPTILRPVRSDGSFDHLQVSQPRTNLTRPVSTESCVIVLDVDESYSARNTSALLSSPRLGTRRNENHAPSYAKTVQHDTTCSRQRHPSESRDVNPDCSGSSLPAQRRSHPTLSLKPIQIQPLKTSPDAFARRRARELNEFYQAQLAAKSRDDGYTSLSEDAKELDCEGSKRTRSLPSSWRPQLSDHVHEANLHAFAKRMTSNEQKVDISNPAASAWCDSTQQPCSSAKPLVNGRTDNCRLLQTAPDEPTGLRKSTERVLEYCTCFLCLRSAVYHCVEEDDTDSLAEHPCDCTPLGRSCCTRWTIIGFMTCLFPFLLCYPPIKGCMNLHDRRLRREKRRQEMKRRRTGDALVAKLSATSDDKRHSLPNGKHETGKTANTTHK